MILDAACRNLEVIVEAANKPGEPYRSAHPKFHGGASSPVWRFHKPDSGAG